MITRLTQRYKVTCDRCGKEEFCDETNPTNLRLAEFNNTISKIASGNVCENCYKDFCEIADNFFNDVNLEDEE